MAKKITIDKLAEMIGEGFNGVDKRFDAIEERMGNMKQELLEHILIVDERVSSVQHGMVRVHDYLNLEKRVAVLEQRLEHLGEKQ